MVDSRNEISGHVTGPVVQAGNIGQVTVHVGAPEDVDMPPLTSWADLPELTSTLRDLLEAQLSATELLPYRLLGVNQPTLTDVYVRQQVRTIPVERSPESDHKQQEDRAARTLTVTEALNGSGHLLITGDAGSGKSTVGYMYVREISKLWLTEGHPGPPPLAEPVLPLRIPARALAEDKAWADLLAAGAEQTLGRLLSMRPKAEVFARRALGARWLVFVDGLDEISEPETRAQVIAAIAHQIRRGVDQRLVITTRQLAARELQPLMRAGVENCALQPFGPVELKAFANAWFRAQIPLGDWGSRAEDFIRQARDSRLRDLVRNPLLATIAAIAKTLEPDRPLPNSRVSLYERFMTYLLDDHPRRRDTLVELRRSLRDAPDRLALVEWAYEHRTELVEHIATRRMDGTSLLYSAYSWVQFRRETLPVSWQSDLAEVLAGTGVFTRTENDLEFRHHSFAEFLAARHRAGAIPADFPDLDAWIERGLSSANREYALFTFVLWGRNDHDIGRVLGTLLAGTTEKVLLAGRLLGEDIEAAPELTLAVVDRLVDLLLSSGVRTNPWYETEEIGKVLRDLPPDSLGAPVFARLRDMRDDPYLAEAVRIECAVTLGNLESQRQAVDWLTRFAEDASLNAVKRSVAALGELGADGVVHVLTRVAERSGDPLTAMVIAKLMLDSELTEPAGRLIGGLCAQLRADPSIRPGADLPPTATRVADTLKGDTAGWGVLADLAARSGRTYDALWAVTMAFAVPDVLDEDFALAAAAAVDCDRVADVLSSAADRPTQHLTQAAERLQERGHHDLAIDLARRAIARSTIDGYQFFSVAYVLTECGAKAELLRIVEETPTLTTEHISHVAQLLPGLGNVPAIVERLRAALADPLITPFDFARIAQVLLASGDRATAQEVCRVATAHGPRHQTEAATVLCEADQVDLGRGLIVDMLARGVHAEAISDLLDEDILGNTDIGLADEILAAVAQVLPDAPSHRQVDVSEALALLGRSEEALLTARRAVRMNIDNSWLENAVEAWLAAGGAAVADEILAEILPRDVTAEHRLEVADKFAEEGLLDAAVTVWLDVVRHHGEATTEGVAAASCLVGCGHRENAVATLDAALADDRLTRPTKADLRALRAWVTA